MKIKPIAQTPLLLAACFLSLICGCSNAERTAAEEAAAKAAIEKAAIEKAAIERVLAEDRALYKRMEESSGFLEKHWSSSKVMSEYVNAIDEIDLTDCPIEFKHAFRAHVSAWKSVMLNEISYSGLRGLVRGMLAPSFEHVSHVSQVAEDALKLVQKTYDEVEKIAIDHGVDL